MEFIRTIAIIFIAIAHPIITWMTRAKFKKIRE